METRFMKYWRDVQFAIKTPVTLGDVVRCWYAQLSVRDAAILLSIRG